MRRIENIWCACPYWLVGLVTINAPCVHERRVRLRLIIGQAERSGCGNEVLRIEEMHGSD
jgi:hypothetical protein